MEKIDSELRKKSTIKEVVNYNIFLFSFFIFSITLPAVRISLLL